MRVGGGLSQVPASESDLRRAGMDLLARREHCREELSSKLRRRFSKRGISQDTLNEALNTLEAAGLLSDVRFAEILVRQLVRKGAGPRKLQAELSQRQLSEDARAHIVSQVKALDWASIAARVYNRKFGSDKISYADVEEMTRERARRGGLCSIEDSH